MICWVIEGLTTCNSKSMPGDPPIDNSRSPQSSKRELKTNQPAPREAGSINPNLHPRRDVCPDNEVVWLVTLWSVWRRVLVLARPLRPFGIALPGEPQEQHLTQCSFSGDESDHAEERHTYTHPWYFDALFSVFFFFIIKQYSE